MSSATICQQVSWRMWQICLYLCALMWPFQGEQELLMLTSVSARVFAVVKRGDERGSKGKETRGKEMRGQSNITEFSVLMPVSLRLPSWKVQSALIGQLSQAWASTAHNVLHQQCHEGTDCIVMTSQCYRSPDSSFEGTVSEYKLCALKVSAFTIFIQHFSSENLIFYNLGPLNE